MSANNVIALASHAKLGVTKELWDTSIGEVLVIRFFLKHARKLLKDEACNLKSLELIYLLD